MSRITPERKIICGLDIGTTKICTIIGNYNETTSEYSVLGIGKVPSSGMKGGIIVDMDKTRDSIDRSVKMALNKAGLEKLDSATIGIAGAHIRSLDAVRSININNSDSKSDANIINKENIDQLHKQIQGINISLDQEIIHVIPQEYIINDNLIVKKPLNMTASKLTLEAHVITAARNSLRDLINCVQETGLSVNEVVLEPLASANSVLTYDQKDLGVALIDIGGGTTDITVFQNGHLSNTGIVGYGGQIISRDIASIAQTSYNEAERIKKDYGFASAKLAKMSGIKEFYLKPVNGRNDIALNSVELSEFIEARIREIFCFAKKHLDKYQLNAGIVLTGGGAMLNGIDKLGEEIFGCNCLVGFPIQLNGLRKDDYTPDFATGIGLLHWENKIKSKPKYPQKYKRSTFWTRLKDKFAQFF